MVLQKSLAVSTRQANARWNYDSAMRVSCVPSDDTGSSVLRLTNPLMRAKSFALHPALHVMPGSMFHRYPRAFFHLYPNHVLEQLVEAGYDIVRVLLHLSQHLSKRL